MKYIFLIIIVILAITGCSTATTKSTLPEKQEINYSALYYYSMAETAIRLSDIRAAVSLLRKAEDLAPESIEIKERLMESLSRLAYQQPDLNQEIIDLGEESINSKMINTKILILLAESYSSTGDLDNGDKYLLQALEREPSMNLYLSYYLFRKNQFSSDEPQLLDKALEMEWTDIQTTLMTIDLIRQKDPDTALEHLNIAYGIWPEETVLRPLLAIYEQRGDELNIMQRIQSHLDAKYPASEFLKSHLISLYFRNRNFQAIVDNQDICLELDKDPLLRYLFFSALTLEYDTLALSTASLMEVKDDLPIEVKPLFYTYYGYLLFVTGNLEKSADAFLTSSNIQLILDVISDYGMVQQITLEKMDTFSSVLLNSEDQKELGYFLSAYLYTLLEEPDSSIKLLEEVSWEYLKQNDLLETTAFMYLSMNEYDLEYIKGLLSQRDTEIPTFNELVGFYYYNTQQDSQAYVLFQEEIEQNPQPSPGLITVTTILAEKYHDLSYLLFVMNTAVDLYPEDPDILNLFGYSIADLQLEEHYAYAYELLTTALQIDPENRMIWDSLSWLYFRMGRFEDALKAMDKLLDQEIDNSEIAYHLGEIYLAKKDRDKGINYLKLAVELDNEPDSVNLAQEILNNLSDPEE